MNKLLTTLLVTFLLNFGYSQTMEYPQYENVDNQLIKHEGFILSYNETCEQANWVKHMITRTNLENQVADRSNKFISDSLVETGSATTGDYYKSGYDRGHLAPAADFYHDQELCDESFNMSNMSPQDPSFNRGMWKRLENFSRSLALAKDTVFVISGPILSDTLKRIGENKVCVPAYYYKIILNSSNEILRCFLLENKKLEGDILDFAVPIEVIEERTGLSFILD